MEGLRGGDVFSVLLPQVWLFEKGVVMRLNKFLAQAGVSSRRGGDELIRKGRVTVNGEVVSDLGRKVEPAKDAIKVDGKRVFTESFHYYLFHKPEGMITTLDDPEGRVSIKEVVQRMIGHVFPVGRLDYNTEGLLFLTNDGELAQKILHPKFQVPRRYEAKVQGILEPETFDRLRRGVRLEDGWASADVRPIRKMEKNSYLSVTVTEGRKHVVRRLMAAVGHEVIHLSRVSFGPLELGPLSRGQWRPMESGEVRRLKEWVEANAHHVAGKAKPGVGKPGPVAGKPRSETGQPRSAAGRPRPSRAPKTRFKNVNLRQRNPDRSRG